MKFTAEIVCAANVLIKSGKTRSAAYKTAFAAAKAADFEREMAQNPNRVFTIRFKKKGSDTIEVRDVMSLKGSHEMGLWTDKETGKKIYNHCIGFYDLSPVYEGGRLVGTKGVRMCLRENFVGWSK